MEEIEKLRKTVDTLEEEYDRLMIKEQTMTEAIAFLRSRLVRFDQRKLEIRKAVSEIRKEIKAMKKATAQVKPDSPSTEKGKE